MKRRNFLQSLAVAGGAALAQPPRANAALPEAKITKVNIYEPPKVNRLVNQSNMIVTVETDIGVTGIGEGGTKEMLEQGAGSLVGQSPFHSEQIWQHMFISWFYPPGREKTHAVGAMDLALWDIKGKVLDLPIHQLLGGTVRKYCECYATGGARPPRGVRWTLRERARATMEAGYRAFRTSAPGPSEDGAGYNTREAVRQTARNAEEIREGVGESGDWCIDFHQRFDYADSVRACRAIEEFEPYFVEDPVRDEHALMDIPKLRMMTTVPLTHGEEWGHRWDFVKLVENHDIDFIRATLPNVGGITEWMKIAALCETHAVGIVPHFTGPVATAALVNCLSTFPGPVMFEYNYGDRPIEHLPECVDFKEGKLYPNLRPGLGVTPDMNQLTKVGEVTEYRRGNFYRRPDGSLSHW